MLDINGYIITEELRSDNAGNSIWGFAVKDDKKYFIKQLKETYYDISYDEATEFQKEYIRASNRFYDRMSRLFSLLKKSDNGNLVVPIEFIKQDGHYYVVSEWIDQFSDFSDIKNFTGFQKYLMMKILAYSVYGMAENNIVHCDLKPDNIRIKETISQARTLKIIDFDNGFIQGDYPDMIGGSQNYMSPEVFIRMGQDEEGFEEKIDITPKADVFSLGIIFHEILTGELPKSCDPKFPYIGIAIGNGVKIEMSDTLADEYIDLIGRMISLEPDSRPDALEVFNALKEIDPLNLSYRR